MGPKSAPKCVECQRTDTMLWRFIEQGPICHECFEQKEIKGQEAGDESKEVTDAMDEAKENLEKNNWGDEKKLRKSTRSTRFKSKTHKSTGTSTTSNGNNNSINSKNQKGRNRRNLFRKVPTKLPISRATTHTVDSVFYNGKYMQTGDVVSVADEHGNIYYAQIRGLLIDDYCEKSAFLSWLIPTTSSPDPNKGFDPPTYLIAGIDEDFSRKLSCLEFVMHAPSNYYYDRTTPFPLPDEMQMNMKPGGFIWTTLTPTQRGKTQG